MQQGEGFSAKVKTSIALDFKLCRLDLIGNSYPRHPREEMP